MTISSQEQFLRLATPQRVIGLSVTVLHVLPHKSTIFAILDMRCAREMRLDPEEKQHNEE